MDDLFEKLKAEPSVGTFKAGTQSEDSESPRRESLPALKSITQAESMKKSSSSSKELQDKNAIGEESLTTSASTKRSFDKSKPVKNKTSSDEDDETPKKQMPTKAQQKLFESCPPAETKLKVKPCKVRIHRDNLLQLRKKFTSESANKLKTKKTASMPAKINLPKPKIISPKATVKRKAETGDSPPAKRGRSSKDNKQEQKKTNSGFFIKLTSSPPTAKKTTPNKSTQRSKTQSPTTAREKSPRKIKEVRGSISSPTAWTTKATKFSRTQLIKDFGKRFFNSTVKIKRCHHPLMLTFELNARARKDQAKNKSKNLSVSFKEQVEIFGCSDTESNYSEENPTKDDEKIRIATPARLKKIENGKVVNDIEFDPSQFVDAGFESNSSTPLRKRVEKKSYSPLKDDSSSSARSEQLKLANEKLPPCGLRRLRDATSEEEDDEDDECEYIVPIDIPERRSSRNDSFNNTIDSTASTKGSDFDGASVTNNIIENDDVEKTPLSLEDVNPKNSSKNEQNDTSQNIPDPSEPSKQTDVKHVSGNGTQIGTAYTDTPKENKVSRYDNESIKLMLDDDSCGLFPTMSVSPDTQDSKLVDAALEKLTENIEMSEIECLGDNELLNTVNTIIADTATVVST